jgi:tRNA (guanine-N7-)-methyltransferase
LSPAGFRAFSLSPMPRELFEAIQTERRAALRTAIAAILPRPDAQLVLEVGCGNGHFLTAYAAAHPDQLCVGVDLRLERTTKALRKRDRAALGNLHFLRCEAWDFLHELPGGVRLLDIYMLFPDPWPKKRHHKNRLFQPAFLDELAARAGQGSRLFFRTDYAPYYEEALQIVAAHGQWQLQPPGPFPFEHQTIFQARAPIYHSLGAVLAAPPK